MGHYSRSASDSRHRRSYSRRRHRHYHGHRSSSRRRYRSSICRHSYSRHHRDYSSSRYRHRDDSRHRRRRSSSSRYRRHRRDRDYSRSHRRYRSNHRNHYHRRRYSSGRRSSEEIIHFKWEKGQKVGGYSIISKISDGTFGRVLYCEKDGINYALKVIRDVERYTNSAKIEIDILLDIKETDEENQSHCVVLHDHFLHKDKNMCLVFEFLGLSLYEFLDKNDFKGFFIADIQTIAFQTLKGLSFLKQKKIIHTDIKPENILLTCKADEFIEVPFPRSKTGMMTKRPATSDVKLVDFGSAIYDEDYHSSIINTRQYRSPEVILDIGWSYSSDIWSLGCTLVEIYTGHLLFKTKTHLEHLAMIERVLGPIPEHMINAARKTDGKQYLHPSDPRIDWPDGCKSKTSISTVEESKSIFELIKPEHRIFAEFIRYILNPDSSARPSPEEAMEHEFFMLKLPEN